MIKKLPINNKYMAKSNQYAQDTELERMEANEYDREIKILEQKRFEQMLGGNTHVDLSFREAVLADIEIYKQGRLEY